MTDRMTQLQPLDTFLAQEFPASTSQTDTSAIERSLILNFRKLVTESSLAPIEAYANLLSIGVALENTSFARLARAQLKELNMHPKQIQECAEIAGIMGMNNVYFKFKSFLPPEVAQKDYPRAGLRTSTVGESLNSHALFEMMALAVSIVNGCPDCVLSHEKSARAKEVSVAKIHDIARLAAVCKGLHSLKIARSL